MTDWSPVQRVWRNRHEAYQYDMFPGYQQLLPDAVSNELPVQHRVQEQQNIPLPQTLPPATNLMQPQYFKEQPNMPMHKNLLMAEGYPVVHSQLQDYPMAQYMPWYQSQTSQNLHMTQNTMIATSPECLLDAASVPLPDDMPLPQNLPLHEDVCMPQYIEQSPEYSITSTSGLNMLLSSSSSLPSTSMAPPHAVVSTRRPDNPREIRNKAEKQRRDRLNRSIADLASMVPPVVAASRKIDKTGVLRLTAHYLRAHEYVFGDSLAQDARLQFKSSSMQAVLGLFNGFVLTVTYKGIIVVVSENVHQYLGYTELDLLGHNILSITHDEDREMLMKHLMPNKDLLGTNGELLIPDEPDGIMKITEALGREKRKFVVRLKKLGQRSEPDLYIRCHVEGSFRKSDKACSGSNRCCQVVRRSRARSENHCSSGNDVVFIGVVRPEVETFKTEISLESTRMEYRTRHSIDGEIIQCEQRIALATGYMLHEVQGVNALNFIHKDDVHWVIIALREMYIQHRLFGESCYRLITKNGDVIFMRTRGRLDVDKHSRVVTSFVCTNTVVGETEGKHLIKMMKKKFNNKTKKEDCLPKLMDKEETEKKDLPVEDPRQLEKVILRLVTNLPSQTEENVADSAADGGASTSRRLAIIPPKKERIVSAIEKIYSVMSIPKDHRGEEQITITEKQEEHRLENLSIPSTSQNSLKIMDLSSNDGASLSGSEIDKITELNDIYIQRQLEESMRMPTTSVCTEPLFTDFDLMTQPIQPPQYNIMIPSLVDYITDDFCEPMVNQSAVEYKYPVFGAPEIEKHQTQSEHDILQMTQPSTSKGSLKRPNEYTERDIVKKKLFSLCNDSGDESPDDDFSCLNRLFDEDAWEKQIESTINSLEQNIDPTFPDLLISNEVQEIMKNQQEN